MFFELLSLDYFWLYFLEFIFAAGFVLFSGHRLAIYGDKIADASKFSHGWIGFILLAFITSLPEMMTGISATAVVGSVDLVISDTIGSNAVNIVILAVMFIVAGKAVIKVKLEEMMNGFAGLFLLTLAGIFILPKVLGLNIPQWMSVVFSIIIVAGYFYTVFIAYKTGGLKEEGDTIEQHNEKNIGWKFTFYALIIVVSAVWMTKSADLISRTPMPIGKTSVVLGQTFVGALLLAIATSLPELSVTLSMAKMGNISMAVGNIFGSNIFNMVIIPVSAIFYRGVYWQDVAPTNFYLVFVVFLVTALMSIDMIYKTKMKKSGFSVLNGLTILAWVAGMIVVFVTGSA